MSEVTKQFQDIDRKGRVELLNDSIETASRIAGKTATQYGKTVVRVALDVHEFLLDRMDEGARVLIERPGENPGDPPVLTEMMVPGTIKFFPYEKPV